METAKENPDVTPGPGETSGCQMCRLYRRKIEAMSDFINWVSGRLSEIAADMNGRTDGLGGIILKHKGGPKGVVH